MSAVGRYAVPTNMFIGIEPTRPVARTLPVQEDPSGSTNLAASESSNLSVSSRI
jgi:hypothetical protein